MEAEKHCFFVPVALNANELLLPAPFPDEGCAIIARTSVTRKLTEHQFGFDYHVYCDHATLQFTQTRLCL